MADEGKEGASVDTSASALLKHIEDKVVGNMYDEHEPIEPKEDSVKEETPEEEPKEDTEKEAPEETPEPEKDKVQKRIDELVARAKTAEEELEEARTKISELSKGPSKEYIPAPTVENPLSDILNFDDLKARENILEQVRANCIRNPDGYSAIDSQGKEVFFDAATVKEALVETDRLLRKDIPNRAKWLERHEQQTNLVKQKAPWLFDGRTAEGQLAKTIQNNFPDLKKLPEYHYITALLILGEKAWNEMDSKSKAKVVETKKVPTPPVSQSTSSTVTKSTPKSDTVRPTRGSSRADIERYIADTMLKDYK